MTNFQFLGAYWSPVMVMKKEQIFRYEISRVTYFSTTTKSTTYVAENQTPFCVPAENRCNKLRRTDVIDYGGICFLQVW